jgi:acyl carrier protein
MEARYGRTQQEVPVTEPSVVTRSDDEIRASVLTMIVDMAPNQDVECGGESRLVEDLGYHSLALMEITFALEDEFDLEPIDEKTARNIRTVGQVQDLVVELSHRNDG